MATVEERLLSKVNEMDNGCWYFLGADSAGGYGFLHVNGQNKYAHRVSWEIFRGLIPIGLHVLHTCDNRKCINPDHLFLGTHRDNTQDMITKGRRASTKGENNGQAILTSEKVVEIKTLLRNGEKRTFIANKYGVSYDVIKAIALNKSWSWLNA